MGDVSRIDLAGCISAEDLKRDPTLAMFFLQLSSGLSSLSEKIQARKKQEEYVQLMAFLLSYYADVLSKYSGQKYSFGPSFQQPYELYQTPHTLPPAVRQNQILWGMTDTTMAAGREQLSREGDCAHEFFLGEPSTEQTLENTQDD